MRHFVRCEPQKPFGLRYHPYSWDEIKAFYIFLVYESGLECWGGVACQRPLPLTRKRVGCTDIRRLYALWVRKWNVFLYVRFRDALEYIHPRISTLPITRYWRKCYNGFGNSVSVAACFFARVALCPWQRSSARVTNELKRPLHLDEPRKFHRRQKGDSLMGVYLQIFSFI